MNEDGPIPLPTIKHPNGCACRATMAASDGAVTYEIAYDVYGPNGPTQVSTTVTATGLDMGDQYVTLRQDRKVVFSIHRDRFATIRRVDAAQAVSRDDAAIEDVANRVEALLLRRLNSAALGRR